MHARAQEGWEGLLVKQARSPYRTGKRSPEWRKLKLEQVDDFIVCGFTEPQGSRARFGALVLGQRVGDDPADPLVYVGDVGTGFTNQEIDWLWRILEPLTTEAPVARRCAARAGAACALGGAAARRAGALHRNDR